MEWNKERWKEPNIEKRGPKECNEYVVAVVGARERSPMACQDEWPSVRLCEKGVRGE